MLIPLTALLLTVQAAESPSALVSKMLARYHQIPSLTGKITFVQSAAGVSISVTTDFAFERPNKLLIRQVRKSSEPDNWLAVCDGKLLSYDVPKDFLKRPGERLRESAVADGKPIPLEQIYAAVSRSLGDRAAPLDIAIGRREDLQFLTGQWTNMRFGSSSAAPAGARVVVGAWRAYRESEPTGTFQIWIGPNADLLRYEISEQVQPDPRTPIVTVASRWDCDLKVGGKADPAVFKVP